VAETPVVAVTGGVFIATLDAVITIVIPPLGCIPHYIGVMSHPPSLNFYKLLSPREEALSGARRGIC